ncbi:MAG: STAS domain-containing protein [Candidatus Sulfotelmatobacter sp.]
MTTVPIPTSDVKLEIVKAPEGIRVRCAGKITSTSSVMLRTEVRGVIPEAKRIVLDLADVTNMDSSGLGALVSLYVSAKGQNCEFKVIHLNQRLQELFRLTKLASVFQGRDDLPWG